jgi:cell division protein FtsI (penicillin-binding protein 3)
VRSTDLRRSTRRVAIARAALLLAFLALGLRGAHLSVFDRRGAAQGDAQSLRTLTLAPERGQVIDRSGVALALSVDAPSVYAVPDQMTDVGAAARALAKRLDLDARALTARLRSGSSFQFVARWVSEKQAKAVQALELRGVGVVREPRRVYPHAGLAARAIGFANIDGRGVRGIEQQEDDWLRGTARRLPVERDGSGRLMLIDGAVTWGTAGGDVALTLDAALQSEAERALAKAVDASGARGGVIVSMLPRSGEILTLAESPSFDPNHFRELDYASTRSSAFLDSVEPGSALKAFLIAAALENGSLSPSDRIDTGAGELRIPGKTIRDEHPHGELDAAGILRVSSNIGAVLVATSLGRSRHYEMLRRFGFGEPTGSGFPDEAAGVLRPWQEWRPVDHATIAFGQGVCVTSVQLAAATAVLANGGEWVRPRLVAARRAPGTAWQPTRRQVVRRVVSRSTANTLVSMLETVVSSEGTGRRAALDGVRVAGKTGTAQKLDHETGRYATNRFRAWFVGIVPADDPQLVIVVGLDEPRGPHHTGGSVAAPLFAQVAAQQLTRFGIHTNAAPRTAPVRRAAAPMQAPARALARADAPDATAADRAAATPHRPSVSAAPPPPEIARLDSRILLPDFRGMTPRQVMAITDAQGLRVKLSGRGRAVSQRPPPGSVVVIEDADILVEFDETEHHDAHSAAARSAPGGQG